MNNSVSSEAPMLVELEVEDESDRRILEDIQEQLLQSPDLKTAMEHRGQMSLCDKDQKEFPVCKTSIKEIGSYSIGLELYFLFLKQMGFLLLGVSLISLWPLYVNYTGDLINIESTLDLSAALSIPNLETDTESSEYLYLWLSNFIYSCIILFALSFFMFQATLRIRKNMLDNIQITDYAIQVSGFPATATSAELKAFFSKYGEIHEIFLARNYSGALFDYKSRANYTFKAAKRKNIVLNRKKTLETDRRYIKYIKKIEEFDEKIATRSKLSKRSHDKLPAIKAFIVFEDYKSKVNCLKEYKEKRFWVFNFQPVSMRFDDKHKLKVSPAPEPSSILYENIEISSCSRYMRSLLAILILAVIMSFSVGLAYAVKTVDDDLPVCERSYSESFAEAQEFESDDDVFCWCKNQSTTDLVEDQDLQDFCWNYLIDSTRSFSLKLASVFGIFFINFFLKKVIARLIHFERQENLSKEQRKIMSRVFLAFFINTGIVILIVNADLGGFSLFGQLLFNGKYKDFDREWYDKVGALYVIMGFLAILSPHIIIFCIKYPMSFCKRKCCLKRYNTQYDLNNALLGGDFNIATRTAQILMVLFIMFLYSGGMPLLNVLCALSIFFIYWTDKYLILRYYRRPPHFSSALYIYALEMMYVALGLHCLFSAYMYGSPDIFNDEEKEDQDIAYRYFESIAGLSMVLVVICILILYMLSWLVLKICNACMNQLHTNSSMRDPSPLSQVIAEMKQRSIVSYDVASNPKYSALIDAINKSAGSKNQSMYEERKEILTAQVVPKIDSFDEKTENQNN